MTVGAQLLLPLTALATAPLLARGLGVVDRGILASVVGVVSLVPALMLTSYPDRLTALVAAEPRRAAAAARAGLLIGLGVGVVSAVLVIALAPAVLGEQRGAVPLLRALALTLVPVMVLESQRALRLGLGDFRQVALERTVGALVRAVGIALFFAAGALTVVSASWLHVGALLAASLLVLPRWHGPPPAARPARAAVREVTREILASSPSRWLGQAYFTLGTRILATLVLAASSAGQAGLFAVAFAVAEVPAIAVTAIRSMVVGGFAKGNDPTVIARVTRLTVVGVSLVALAGAAATPLVVPLLFGRDFTDAVVPTVVLLAAAVPAAVARLLSTGMASLGRVRAAVPSQVVGLLVIVAGLLLVVPSLGALGACLTVLAASTVTLVMLVAAGRRALGLGVRELLVPRRSDLSRG